MISIMMGECDPLLDSRSVRGMEYFFWSTALHVVCCQFPKSFQARRRFKMGPEASDRVRELRECLRLDEWVGHAHDTTEPARSGV